MPDQLFIILTATAAGFAIIAIIAISMWRMASKSRRQLEQECRLQRDQIVVANRERREIEQKYRPILDIDAAVMEAKERLTVAEVAFRTEKSASEKMIAEIKADYAAKKVVYDRLNHEISSLEERLDFAELGIYKPVFNFDDSAHYAEAIEINVAKQKIMISAGKAIISETKWIVEGSEAKGKVMTNRAIRMTLRAFNNECEVIVRKASWKNFHQMQERIRKSQNALDKLNESSRLRISEPFVSLKLEALRLTYEERLKKYEEQEKLREEREREREEAKAQRELEAEIKRAEKKEEQRREALMEARAELRAAGEAEKAILAAKIGDLEAQLSAAHAATERAMSMAQQTRVGYVYVISNVGAFGEDVFKIGMTRRLEPRDRVRELGDASVPFPFDIHALIFTEDAPALERALQVELEAHRVNRVNQRREFFKVPPADLKAKVLARFPDVVYLDRPEAQEYLQSLPKPIIETMAAKEQVEAFPSVI